MDSIEKKDVAEQKPFQEIIKGLEDGKIDPKDLPEETRLRCIAYFDDKGFTAQEVGDIFRMSDRNVRRILVKINSESAETINGNWIRERFSEFYNSFRLQYKRALRLSNDSQATVSEKQQGVYLAWRIQKEFIQTLNSLGLSGSPREPVQQYLFEESSDSRAAKEEFLALVQKLLKNVPARVKRQSFSIYNMKVEQAAKDLIIKLKEEAEKRGNTINPAGPAPTATEN